MTEWHPAFGIAERGPVVAGIQVGPVTLGHLELIAELGIDIMGAWSRSDVAILALILAQPAEKSRRDLTKWWMRPLLWYIGRRTRDLDMDAEAKRLGDWLNAQLSGPRVVRDLSRKSRHGSAPLHFHLLGSVMSRLNMSIEDARRLPVRTALQLVLAAAEAAGEAELWSEKDQAFVEWCEASTAAKRS